jgi:hypothetical protein
MKRILLTTTFCLCFAGLFKASAQDFPYMLTVFEDAIYYGMYEATVNEPVPAGAIRHSNSSYGKKLTDEQLDSFGNTLTMTVKLNPLCDNYDRIGNVNLAFVPKGATDYVYNEVTRIEIGRFITPFMDMHEQPNEVPYMFFVDNLTQIFHDDEMRAQYDFWVELEVYGYQGGPGQGGAAVEIPGCAGRNDVYQGTLEFFSEVNPNLTYQSHYIQPLSFKYELKNYTLDGTDVLGETTKTINFTVTETVENAKLYFINSNHGSYGNGEEYNRRWHYLSVDGEEVLQYRPGGLSCVPYYQYNTQPNCIYLQCNIAGNPPRPDTNAAWSWNNWCPGNKIPIRVINLGTLAAGDHTFNINVPDAVFEGGQGYFPMSLYLQGGAQTLGGEAFEETSFKIYPNPTTDNVEIVSQENIKAVSVYNNLGQVVMTANTKNVDLTSLQNGVYMIEVKFEGDMTVTRKVIKN